MIGLSKCLVDPTITPTKSVLSFAKYLMDRLYLDTIPLSENEDGESSIEIEPEPAGNTIAEELNSYILNATTVKQVGRFLNNTASLKQEFNLFKRTDKRTPRIIVRGINHSKADVN